MKTAGILIGLILLTGIAWLTYSYTKDIRPNPSLIGGDTDQHGCLIPAGYSWCEANQACLRTWEEPCNINTTEHDIIELFANKYQKAKEDVRVEFTTTDSTHIRGSVRFAPFNTNNEGGLFLAVQENNQWKLVYDGNGSVDCQNLAQYDFPATMLTGVCD